MWRGELGETATEGTEMFLLVERGRRWGESMESIPPARSNWREKKSVFKGLNKKGRKEKGEV